MSLIVTVPVTPLPLDIALVDQSNTFTALQILSSGISTTTINGNIITPGVGILSLGNVTLSAGTGGLLGSNAFSSIVYVPITTTVNTHPLSGNIILSTGDIGLSAVTNDTQTKASIVPNIIPLSGQILIGNTGNTAYSAVSINGDGTLSPNGSLNITKSAGVGFGSLAFQNASAIAITGGTITGLSNPTNPSDVSTKSYVDSQLQNFDLKDPVAAATVIALPFSPTYSNGSSGVGATLTGGVGVLAFDGYTPVIGDRLLIKNEATTANNGIYVLTRVGTILIGYQLTRSADFNQTSNILYGDSVGVLNGVINVNQQFTMNNQNVITVGTTVITFSQTSGGSQLTAGNGITITGNNIAVTSPLSARVQILRGVPSSINAVVPNDAELGQEQRTDALGVPYEILLQGFGSKWYSLAFTQYNGTSAIPPSIITRPFIGSYTIPSFGNGTSVEGNTLGLGAVDLQMIRTTATQVASGPGSFCAGRNNTASNTFSVAIGDSNISSGNASVAIGESNQSSGNGSAAFGAAISRGTNSMAMGANSIALGDFTFAVGGGIALGITSVASVGIASRDNSFAEGKGAGTSMDSAAGQPYWIISGAAGLVLTVTTGLTETDATHVYSVNDVLIIYDSNGFNLSRITVTAVTATTITVTGITTAQATTYASHGAWLFHAYCGPAWSKCYYPVSNAVGNIEGDDLTVTTTGAASGDFVKGNIGTVRSTYYLLSPGCTYSFDIIITGQAADGASMATARMVRSCMMKYPVNSTIALVGTVDTIGTDKLDASLASCTVTIAPDNVNKRLAISVFPTGVAGGIAINWDATITARRVFQGN